MKTQELIHATRVKQAPECVAESNKLVGNGKRMSARKSMDLYGSETRTQGLGITYMYLANTREVGHGLVVRESVVWQWGEGGANFGVPAQTLLGEMYLLG